MVKITKVIKNKDGSVNLDIEYNPKILHPIIRTYYKKTKCTKKLIKTFLLKVITDYVDNKYERSE